jgi:hypothetical protein
MYPTDELIQNAMAHHERVRGDSGVTPYSCYCTAYAVALTGGAVDGGACPRNLAVSLALGAQHGTRDRTSNTHDGIKSESWLGEQLERLLVGEERAVVAARHGDVMHVDYAKPAPK